MLRLTPNYHIVTSEMYLAIINAMAHMGVPITELRKNTLMLRHQNITLLRYLNGIKDLTIHL